MTTLAIIIISWNTADLLRTCLASIEAHRLQPGWEVIVVDNASSDGSAEMVQAEFPNVTLIKNANNEGFGKANNIGMAQTNADVIVLLNSDTEASVATIESLRRQLDENPCLGVLSPMLITPAGKAQAFAYGADPTIGYLLSRAWNRLLFKRALHDWNVPYPISVDWVAGTCMVVRGSILRAVHGFDESFFMYFEDADLCKRIRGAGLDVIYDPRSEILHIGGQSMKKNKRAQDAYQNGLITFYKKHYGFLATLLLKAMLPIYSRFM